jgi:hypothetical protein
MPESLFYVWVWFTKLHGTRQSGVGLNPISFQEISAFCQLYDVIMCTWEIDLILQLDHVALIESQKDS